MFQEQEALVQASSTHAVLVLSTVDILNSS